MFSYLKRSTQEDSELLYNEISTQREEQWAINKISIIPFRRAVTVFQQPEPSFPQR